MRTKRQPHDQAFSLDAGQVPSCALDEQGLERQRERCCRLAPSVVRMRRDEDHLVVDFAPDFDRHALEELIAVERECCPFFTFSFDQHSRHLEIGVHDLEAAAALDAIAHRLSARTADV
jgi:hypothetical protein